MKEAILNILKIQEVDPEKIVQTDTGPRTAFEILEGYVFCALDAISEV